MARMNRKSRSDFKHSKYYEYMSVVKSSENSCELVLQPLLTAYNFSFDITYFEDGTVYIEYDDGGGKQKNRFVGPISHSTTLKDFDKGVSEVLQLIAERCHTLEAEVERHRALVQSTKSLFNLGMKTK